MTDTMDKTYLISNDQHVGALPDDGIYESTWILFAEPPVIESGFDSAAPLIEVYKYISSNSGTQTKSKVVAVDEARAEWKFWIGQGFQRITDKENKGWKYTGDMRAGLANYRFAKEMQKKLTAKVGEIEVKVFTERLKIMKERQRD